MKKHLSTLTFSFSEFVKALVEFFFPTKRKLSGKLFVSGTGSLEFKFKHCPQHVFVYFADEQSQFPCDPGSDDTIDWEIICCHSCCQLVIRWEVQGMRKIAWKVC